MKLDRQNTIVVSVGSLCFAIAAMLSGLVAHDRAEDLRTEQQITERVRIEACTSIEDEDTRALCILGTKAADK